MIFSICSKYKRYDGEIPGVSDGLLAISQYENLFDSKIDSTSKEGVTMAEHVHRVDRVTEIHDGINDGVHPADSAAVFLARIIYFIFGVIIAIIIVRMVLMMLGANQGNGFVDLVYGVSSVFVAPFYGIFGTPTYGASIFDMNALIAIIVYALISWGLAALVTLGLRDRSEV